MASNRQAHVRRLLRSADATPLAENPSDAIASPPPGRARLIVSIFIGAAVLWQVALPLTYYLGEYRYDERFSWRMFSHFAEVQARCIIRVDEAVSDFNPKSPAPQSLELWTGDWLNLLKRGRPAVVGKFLHKRCHDNPQATHVHLIRICPIADRSILSGEIVMNCGLGIVTKREW